MVFSWLQPFHGSASSVTSSVDKSLITSELLELYGKENKSKNPIVGCKDREKTFKNEIRRFFLEISGKLGDF